MLWPFTVIMRRLILETAAVAEAVIETALILEAARTGIVVGLATVAAAPEATSHVKDGTATVLEVGTGVTAGTVAAAEDVIAACLVTVTSVVMIAIAPVVVIDMGQAAVTAQDARAVRSLGPTGRSHATGVVSQVTSGVSARHR